MDLKTATWILYCLRLRSRSPHNAQHSTSIHLQVGIVDIHDVVIGERFCKFNHLSTAESIATCLSSHLKLGNGVKTGERIIVDVNGNRVRTSDVRPSMGSTVDRQTAHARNLDTAYF